jgi:hypothetical protein
MFVVVAHWFSPLQTGTAPRRQSHEDRVKRQDTPQILRECRPFFELRSKLRAFARTVFPTQCRRLSMGAVGIAAVLQLWSAARRSSAALPHRRAPGFRFRQPIRLSDLEHSRGHSNERCEDRYSEGLSPRPVHRPFEAPRSIQAGRSLPAANGTQAVRAATPQRGRGYHSWACGRPRIDAGLLRDLR